MRWIHSHVVPGILLAIVLSGCASTTRKPNIVVILADDLGYGDLGVTECPDIGTPNIDRLAAEGVRFTNAYANAPVCNPTRTALLTGSYQQRAGMEGVLYVDERNRGLTLDAMLLPELLQKEGYATGIIGKWHLGFPKEYFPTRRGFDYFFGFLAGNIDYFAHTDRYENHDLWRNETEIWQDGRYMTDLIGDESIQFIRRNRSAPFFLYVPFSAPHDPFQGPGDADTAMNQTLTRTVNRTRAKFGEMVESMDSNIGRILKEIEEQNLQEDTVVFFMSDNGGLSDVARNTPFSGQKATLWEGGIRSPLIARWIPKFAAGRIAEAMVAGMDLFPTALAIAGAEIPTGLDGVNLLPVLEGTGGIQRNTLYFHYENPYNPGEQKAMIQDGWKYLQDTEGNEHLFHLSQDLSETKDLAQQSPDRLERMKQEYEDWHRAVSEGAPYEPPYQIPQ